MKYDIDVDILKDLYYGERLSVTDVAKRLGVPWHSVYNSMKRYGLKRRSRSEAQQIRYEGSYKGPSIEKILALYFDQELSSFEVARRVGLSQSTIRDRINNAGYSLRTVSESRLRQKVGRVLIVFPEDQQEEIRDLYCVDKLSFATIGVRFDVSPQIIKRTLLDMGVVLRTSKESQQIRRNRELEFQEKEVLENVGEVLDASAVSEEIVIDLYKKEGLLLDEVALKCSKSRGEVYKILRDAGILPDYSGKFEKDKK